MPVYWLTFYEFYFVQSVTNVIEKCAQKHYADQLTTPRDWLKLYEVSYFFPLFQSTLSEQDFKSA